MPDELSLASKPHTPGTPPLLLLAGPTAVGKSAVALALAEKVGGEIISVDSMQVYRGLDIGTAKPSAAERARVRHHLIDVVDLEEEFDASRFVDLAEQAVAEIQARGRVPIFCGGTGLYFRAFLHGLGQTPPPDPVLRRQLEETPREDLLRELAACDPALHRVIDQQNLRRVIRALQVIRQSGQPYSTLRALWPHGNAGSGQPPFLVLWRERSDLQARIGARVDQMFAQGLVEETESLLQQGLAQNRTALQAIGYCQVYEHLQGRRSLEETIALIKRRTWQFARRQMTWFRREPGVRTIFCASSKTAREICDDLPLVTLAA